VLTLVHRSEPVPSCFTALGRRGKPADMVANEAIEQLHDHLGAKPASVDPYGADQLIPPLYWSDQPSHFGVSTVTKHLLTNIETVKLFGDREIEVEGSIGSPGNVRFGRR
jgi:RNA 3'-terminal phosphate cyclase (ATP)